MTVHKVVIPYVVIMKDIQNINVYGLYITILIYMVYK
jgi:hypothetical protein